MAGLIHLRMDQLKSAPTVEMLLKQSIGRCHSLQGDRKGEYAMDLVHPYRLVFEQKGIDLRVIRINKIEDYH